MKNYLKIDFYNSKIVMDRMFAKSARDVDSDAYNKLQRARADYPNYTVEIYGISRNKNKETYRGLTYAYMERYISLYDPDGSIRSEYDVLRLRAECHTIRYPAIKHWFLTKFPEVKDLKMGSFTIDDLPAKRNDAA